MQTADVVLYDRYVPQMLVYTARHQQHCCQRSAYAADLSLFCRLVSPDILRLVHDGARMVYVGKQKGFHTRTQDEIHELLCHFAMEGSSVLRLKGGDPFVFGRGGEEVQYLQQRNIKTHVIPGMLRQFKDMAISSDWKVPSCWCTCCHHRNFAGPQSIACTDLWESQGCQ